MKSEHIMNFLKDGSFSMPYYLIQFRKELSVSDMDLIVLAYLENLGDHFRLLKKIVCRKTGFGSSSLPNPFLFGRAQKETVSRCQRKRPVPKPGADFFCSRRRGTM